MALTLKIATLVSRTTLQPMIVYHHTRFGYYSFSLLSGQTVMDILNVGSDLDLEHGNPKFPLEILAYDDFPST